MSQSPKNYVHAFSYISGVNLKFSKASLSFPVRSSSLLYIMSINQSFNVRPVGTPSLPHFQFTAPIENNYPLVKPKRGNMSTIGEPAFGGGHHLHDRGPHSARTPNHDWTPYSAVRFLKINLQRQFLIRIRSPPLIYQLITTRLS